MSVHDDDFALLRRNALPVMNREEEVATFTALRGVEARLSAEQRKRRQSKTKIAELTSERESLRDKIVRSNILLVLAMASRSRNTIEPLPDRVSLAIQAVLSCVDEFKPELGWKFSTYACRAILNRLSRSGQRAARAAKTFRADDFASLYAVYRDTDRERAEDVEFIKAVLADNRAGLTETEAYVVRMRFGLSGEDPLSLQELGSIVGLTKERVRQLQMSAMEKLRATVQKSA